METDAAGCTFEEDPDVSLCEYRQGQEDDFDWQLVRTTSWPYVPSDLTRAAGRDGPEARDSSPAIRSAAPILFSKLVYGADL
ncbi:hypothetical protein SRHO_G00015360 [Serrasalmus rhombeus]